jgi:hypothetical protein
LVRALERSILAGLAVMLAGCSPAALMEKVPADLGGLPADAPAAPTTPYQYPVVHDMPPPRSDAPLTEEQQYKLEKDLQAARDRLEGENQADQAAEKKDAPKSKKPAGKKDAQKAKKKAKTVKKPENAGAATNP